MHVEGSRIGAGPLSLNNMEQGKETRENQENLLSLVWK